MLVRNSTLSIAIAVVIALVTVVTDLSIVVRPNLHNCNERNILSSKAISTVPKASTAVLPSI
jgi:hypothetical protein